MTCKDCICSEVCYYKSFNDEKHLKKRRDDVEKICKSFVHRDRLKNAPTVDAVGVVHGHWLECEGTVCSVCNKHFFTDGPWAVANYKANYCPNRRKENDYEGKLRRV